MFVDYGYAKTRECPFKQHGAKCTVSSCMAWEWEIHTEWDGDLCVENKTENGTCRLIDGTRGHDGPAGPTGPQGMGAEEVQVISDAIDRLRRVFLEQAAYKG